MGNRFRLRPKLIIAGLVVLARAGAAASTTTVRGGTISSGGRGKGGVGVVREDVRWGGSDRRTAGGVARHQTATQLILRGPREQSRTENRNGHGNGNDFSDSRRSSFRPSPSSSSLTEACRTMRGDGSTRTPPRSSLEACRMKSTRTPPRSSLEACRMNGGGTEATPPPPDQQRTDDRRQFSPRSPPPFSQKACGMRGGGAKATPPPSLKTKAFRPMRGGGLTKVAPPPSLLEAFRVRGGGGKVSLLPSSLEACRARGGGATATPPPSLLKYFRVRGGAAKVAPPPPSSEGAVSGAAGSGSSSSSAKPPAWSALGPITRQNADGGAGKEGQGQGQGEGQQEFAPQFLDFQSRVGFMKKVYLTVSVQLVYTGLVCALMRGYREPILQLLFGHGKVPQILFFVSTIATIFGTNAVMWSNVELRQSFPRNLPLLTAFTTAWALYVGVFSLMFTQGSVIRAVFQAAFVVGSLTAYAFRTNPKHELTQLGAGLYSAGNALGMFCLMKLFFFRGHRASDLALSCFATLFFSLYLVYDTYRIIGGKHRQSGMFGVKDWAVAAMALYEDIMQIFIHLLALFGEAQR